MIMWQWIRAQWDRVLGGVLFVVGGLFVLLGWIGVAGEALTARQVPYVLSGGMGGIFLLGLGAVFWISADLRDEWRKLDAIEQRLSATQDGGSSDVDHHGSATDGTAELGLVEAIG